jgi:hypothetical protein
MDIGARLITEKNELSGIKIRHQVKASKVGQETSQWGI